jgi:hypothetical protein
MPLGCKGSSVSVVDKELLVLVLVLVLVLWKAWRDPLSCGCAGNSL